MTAFTGTPASSAVHTDQTDGSKADGTAVDAKIHIADSGVYTHALGAGTGAVNMLILPPGKIKVYPDLCRIITTALAASSTIDVGHRAHTTLAGAAVVENVDALHDGADSTSALDEALTLPAGGVIEYNSQAGVVIAITVLLGNIEDADTLRLLIAYTGPTP